MNLVILINVAEKKAFEKSVKEKALKKFLKKVLTSNEEPDIVFKSLSKSNVFDL
ncbi:hypothetical protein KHA93_18670 [Bacillus sp. FJAT-49732]|uniref:Uncharacterized protein n=1 Tax=Lederbergia citrisecunda TaxID=2833583 RepID=A0A942TNP0_9BACI|nr:hypothetical protein [Lederbergia citrisecunda]MBS4201641.1 hypothetical protein [Lederbergia citrisecunda]